MKDYLKDGQQNIEVPVERLRSAANPTGRDRKNRLNTDFESDISIRKDQARNKFIHQLTDSGSDWDPQEYL